MGAEYRAYIYQQEKAMQIQDRTQRYGISEAMARDIDSNLEGVAATPKRMRIIVQLIQSGRTTREAILAAQALDLRSS